MGKWDIDRNVNQNERCLKVYMEMYDLLIQEKKSIRRISRTQGVWKNKEIIGAKGLKKGI